MDKAKKFVLVAVIVSAGLAGLAILLLQAGSPQKEVTRNQSSTNSVNSTQVNSDQTLIIGNKNAPVTIVEYADYKCPECGKLHSGVGKRIRTDYIDTGKINIEFRPYPVWGEEAGKALAGSYCAQEQGKFTQYYDAMFGYMWDTHFEKGDYQKAIDPVFTEEVLQSILSNIGIDKSAYDTCLTDTKTRQAYDAAVNQAAPDGVQGTPTFIIGGQKVVGNQPYDVYATLLDIQQ